MGDGPIYVSPAMWELLSNADEKELRHLLANIPLLNLPAFSFTEPMPLTTSWT